jgi:translation initiation factor RLI1
MRIAVINKDRCQPRKCAKECEYFCPPVRTGDETITFVDGKPVITESLCVGCGICVRKCPFGAITIINLPDELENPTHRYGENGFALYGLPVPTEGRVTGLLGPNGIGKSTAVAILSGLLAPNLGRGATWNEVIESYSGSALGDYLRKVVEKGVKTAYKPQYVDRIPKSYSGTVEGLLEKTDERGALAGLAKRLNLSPLMDREISSLSGGELQRVAIVACAARDADVYFFDEISPYLDIYQRINAASAIRELSETRSVMVVEHDLALLDLLAENVHLVYGTPGAYGVITRPKGVRVGINQYIKGYFSEENIRVRSEPIVFEVHAPRAEKDVPLLVEYDTFTKKYSQFVLEAERGEIRRGEVVGILGPNGIGKSTYIKMLAGVELPTKGNLDLKLKVSYKPGISPKDHSGVRLQLLPVGVRKADGHREASGPDDGRALGRRASEGGDRGLSQPGCRPLPSRRAVGPSGRRAEDDGRKSDEEVCREHRAVCPGGGPRHLPDRPPQREADGLRGGGRETRRRPSPRQDEGGDEPILEEHRDHLQKGRGHPPAQGEQAGVEARPVPEGVGRVLLLCRRHRLRTAFSPSILLHLLLSIFLVVLFLLEISIHHSPLSFFKPSSICLLR